MTTFYEEVGGTEFFEELISAFYAVVAVDPILSPMYPEQDWHAAAERLQMFLEQYWGGPTTYSETRGHPRLRLRHIQFFIELGDMDGLGFCGSEEELDILYSALCGEDIEENLENQE